VYRKSSFDDKPLRYSLRSLKNLPHRNVVIIGDCPLWTTEVSHIRVTKEYKSPTNDVRHKLSLTDHPDITDDFILMNDDFYILQPQNDVTVYHKGTLAESLAVRNPKSGWYYKTLLATTKRYPNGLDYSHHSPFVYNKHKLHTLLDAQNALLWRSAYGNEYTIKSEFREDCKVFSVKELQDTDLLSSSPKIERAGFFWWWLDKRLRKGSYKRGRTQYLW